MNIGYFYAMGAAVAWGLLYAIDQKILNHASPIGLTFISSLVGVLFTLPIILSKGGIRAALGGDNANWPLIFASAAIMTVSGILVLAGIQELNATYVSIIEMSYPFFVILFSFLLFKTVPGPAFYAGGALIMIGTFVIISSNGAH